MLIPLLARAFREEEEINSRASLDSNESFSLDSYIDNHQNIFSYFNQAMKNILLDSLEILSSQEDDY